ncbi:MAG: LysR family transcriptional regulator, partial [Aquificae bacterium]|nr:LysR family transcriptional regulator [Aquificota bacterium]
MEVLDYHKLKIFKTVADTGSFSKAAELLFLSQPTVTLQIKKIENYLGVVLFKRDKKKVVLTEEGKILYQYASKIIEDYLLLEEGITNLKEGLQKRLVIGASTTIGEFLLPEKVSSFIKDKDISFNLFIGNSKEIEEGILSKSFYIGLIEDEISSTKFEKIPFYSDEIILIASSNTKTPEFINLSELKNFKFIFREKGSGTRNIVEKYLKEKNINILPTLEISSSKAIAKIIEKTNYLAFVSKLVVEEDLKKKKLKHIKIKNFNIKRDFYVITQKNIRLPKLEREFLE